MRKTAGLNCCPYRKILQRYGTDWMHTLCIHPKRVVRRHRHLSQTLVCSWPCSFHNCILHSQAIYPCLGTLDILCQLPVYLIQKENVGCIIPTVRISFCAITILIDQARTIQNDCKRSISEKKKCGYPNSIQRPIIEEQPGPPFNHRTRGSFWGLDLEAVK